MSIAAFPKTVETASLPDVRHFPGGLPRDAGRVNLTTYRISKSYHGRTLQVLGHAAEYLVNSRRFLIEESASEADEEAVRILMRLSSRVFREYAESMKVRRPIEDFVMGCANRIFE